MKKLLSFFMITMLLVALYGCGGGGGSATPFPKSDIISSNEDSATVTDGKLDKPITFNHEDGGITTFTCEDGTFQDGVKLNVKEVKTTNAGLNPLGTPQNIYIYMISELQGNENAEGVTVLNKPITVTLPTNHLGTEGICYVGVRNSENDPWTYTRLEKSGTVVLNIHSLRFAEAQMLEPSYTFSLYRANVQVALFALKAENEDKTKIITADSLSATSTATITYKNGAFLDDLKVDFVLTGLNLDKINPQDLIACITYRSKDEKPADIKVNGVKCTYKTSGAKDKTVDGKDIYFHSFEIAKLEGGSMSAEAKYSFTLNIKGMKITDFSTDFLMEIGSSKAVDGYELIPFSYAKAFSFSLMEKASEPSSTDTGSSTNTATDTNTNTNTNTNTGTSTNTSTSTSTNTSTSTDTNTGAATDTGSSTGTGTDTSVEVYNISYNLDGGKLTKSNPATYTVETKTFTLNNPTKTGYTFTGWSGTGLTGKANTTVTIAKGSTGERIYTANFTPINYNIAYQNTDGAILATPNPTTYTVETETITLTNPTKDDYFFLGWTYEGQTTPQLEVKIIKGSTGAKSFTANWEAKAIASLKSADTDFAVNGQIQIEFNKEITWQDSYKSKITITPSSTISTYAYSNRVLTITPATNLKYNTGYTIAIAGMEKVSDKNLTFSTLALNVTPEITSASSNTVAILDGKTIFQPVYTIDFGKAVVNQETARSHIQLNSSALPNLANLSFSSNGKIATLTFSINLDVVTSYQLGITGFTDDDNSTISSVNKAFNILTEDIIGNGTENSPYLIFTQAHLQKVCDNVYRNEGNSGRPCFKQMNDISLTEPWTTIGLEPFRPFIGIYDGNNHKITGLTTTSSKGLFSIITGDIENKSEIKNLTIENVSILGGHEYLGALAGSMDNTRISNVHVVGNINIQGSSAVGGLVGDCTDVEISCCSVVSANGVITVGNSGFDVGGLIGQFIDSGNSSISESYASVGVEGRTCVGGLVGCLSNCIIENSYANCTITVAGNSPYSVGGLLGAVSADNAYFNKCYSKGTISIESTTVGDVGGLCGKIQFSNLNYQNSTNSFTSVTINVSQGYTYDSNNYHPYNPEDEQGSVPLYYSQLGGYSYIYSPDETNHNYVSNGYLNALDWSTDAWSGLAEGQFPKLKWEQ